MTKEEFSSKAKAALDELWQVQSTDAVEDIKVFKKAGWEGAFLARLLHDGCSDKFFKAVNLEAAYKLIEAACKERVWTKTTFTDALNKIAARWIDEDLFCDAPLCVDNLSKVMAHVVKINVVDLKYFEEGFKPFMAAGQAKKAVKVLLEQLAKSAGQEALVKMYKESKLDLAKFLPANRQSAADVGDFLNQSKLLYLEPVLGLPSTLTSLLQKVNEESPDIKDLADVLATTPVSDESLFTVTKTVCEFVTLSTTFGVKKFAKMQYDRMSAEDRKEKKSQRPVEGALATEKALYEEMKKVVCGWVAATKKRLPPKTQLSVLYAFQEVAHMYDHPKGMLGNLFYSVYDWEFIEHEIFDLWREAVDDDRYSGKQMALPTLSKFFTWYSTEDKDE